MPPATGLVLVRLCAPSVMPHWFTPHGRSPTRRDLHGAAFLPSLPVVQLPKRAISVKSYFITTIYMYPDHMRKLKTWHDTQAITAPPQSSLVRSAPVARRSRVPNRPHLKGTVRTALKQRIALHASSRRTRIPPVVRESVFCRPPAAGATGGSQRLPQSCGLRARTTRTSGQS